MIVVIPVKGQLGYTKSIIEQLRGNRVRHEGQIVIYDNGSPAQTRNWLRTNRDDLDFTLVDADNMSIYQMWNEGIRWGQRCKEDAAILNNDLILGERFIDQLQEGLSSDGNWAAVCGNYDDRTDSDKVVEVKSTFKNGGFAGFGFAVKSRLFGDKIDFIDENFQWWFGDDDLVASVEKAGYKNGLVIDAHMEHIQEGTARHYAGELSERIKKDMVYMEEKWGHY